MTRFLFSIRSVFTLSALLMGLVIRRADASSRGLHFFNVDVSELADIINRIPSGPPVPQADTCWFCNDANFSGGCLEREVGDAPDLFPYHNDYYRSARCGNEVFAEIFTATNYGGRKGKIINDEPDFKASGFDNQISSLRIIRRPKNSVAAIRDNGFYNGLPYIKEFSFVPEGIHDDNALKEFGVRQDRPLDKIDVPEGFEVDLRAWTNSVMLQSIGPPPGTIWGPRITLSSGLHDLRKLTYQEVSSEYPQGMTVRWADRVRNMIVRPISEES